MGDALWTLTITPGDAAVRLGAAVVCGAVIGIDRQLHHRAAGLRTQIMVALAAATFTIIAFELYGRLQPAEGVAQADPLRLLEAITGGVAFLAAGAIIRQGSSVSGLTTGVSLWLSGALGMASGQAMYGLAALALAMAFVVLTLLRWIEHRLLPEPDA